jgi:outer membrane receptor protein involved in Fe transport
MLTGLSLRALSRRKLEIISILSGVLLIFWVGNVSSAETGKDTDQVYQLSPITVMAPQPGVEINVDKTIINMDDFRKAGTVRNLTDVLKEIGAVDVQRINPLISSPGDEVSIRGLNEGRLVIEIDGRRINHTGHNGRYIVDWSTLNMDDVERIEIIRGGHSVLHPFAIGGVINLITKKGKKTEDPKPDFSISGGYGSFETSHLRASVDGGAGNFLGYHLSAGNQETDGYLRNNFQENKNINGHFTFFLPSDATLKLGAKLSDVSYGFPVVNDPSRGDYDPDYPEFLGTADQLRHLPSTLQFPGDPKPYWDKETHYLDAIFEIPFGPGTFSVHGFQTEGKRDTYFYQGGNFIESFIDDRSRGVIAEYRDVTLFDRHSFTFGAEYQELGSPSGNPTIYIVKSLYFQDVIKLGDRWKITPGVRYYSLDKDTYFAWFESGGTSPAFPTTGKKETDEDWFPSLKVDFQANDTTALYAAVSRSYRLPCP